MLLSSVGQDVRLKGETNESSTNVCRRDYLSFLFVARSASSSKHQGAFDVQYLGGICSIPDFLQYVCTFVKGSGVFVYLIGKTLEQAMEKMPKQYDRYAKLPTSKVSRLSKYWEV